MSPPAFGRRPPPPDAVNVAPGERSPGALLVLPITLAAVKRPFWMHQLAEYVLGAALLGYGARCPTPAVPSILGAIVVLHAASTRGPLAAFRGIPRRLHRVVDVGIIAVEFVVFMLVGTAGFVRAERNR